LQRRDSVVELASNALEVGVLNGKSLASAGALAMLVGATRVLGRHFELTGHAVNRTEANMRERKVGIQLNRAIQERDGLSVGASSAGRRGLAQVFQRLERPRRRSLEGRVESLHGTQRLAQLSAKARHGTRQRLKDFLLGGDLLLFARNCVA